MGLLLVKADFVETFALAKTIEDSIDAYITQYEKQYLAQLLGVELFKLFEADVDGGTKKPLTPIYLSLYNSISEDHNNLVMQSEGMKSMLLGLIWFQYVRIEKFDHTAAGVKVNTNELSREAGTVEGFLNKRYNESVIDWRTIQWFICDNSSDYPDYNGQQLLFNLGL